jgi:short-subunit dehydrogenase
MPEAKPKLAVVTGASGGIGVDFARELASRNYDLILSARRADQLQAIQSQIEAEFPASVETIPADLGKTAEAKRLFDVIDEKDRPVKVLVNNAGLGQYGSFLEQSLEEMESVISVNVTSLTVLTRLFAQQMVRHGSGHILNHASFSAIQPPSNYAVYSGTKSYVMSFSLALRSSLLSRNVNVTTLCPGFFDSHFSEHAGHDPGFCVHWLTLRQAYVARCGIEGLFKRKALVIPSLRYKFLNLMARLLPRTVVTRMADIAMQW